MSRFLLSMFVILLVITIGIPHTSFANHPSVDDPPACTSSINHLLVEMTAGRAYVQFHTNDGQHPENTGPGDLNTPGEIRGDIKQTLGSMDKFTATADKSQNVIDGDDSPWNAVTATADLTFTTTTSGHHSHVAFSFDVNGLSNVVGIHMHNGSPEQSNPIHLVDFLTSNSSLIKNIDSGPIQSMNGTYTGMITSHDVCPSSHTHDDNEHIHVSAPAIIAPTDSSKVIPTLFIEGTADPGVFVEVFTGMTSVGRTISDSSGMWSMQVLEPLNAGHHIVTVVATDGFGNSSARSEAVSIMVVDRLGAISGTVFVVTNGNKVTYSGDPITIRATNSENDQMVETNTLADGRYTITDMIPGSYKIQIHHIPEGYFLSSIPSKSSSHDVLAGPAVHVNFELKKTSAESAPSVSGTVFSDDNGNGKQDDTEPGVEGITIVAISETGKVVYKTTESNGKYSFKCGSHNPSDCIDPGMTLIQTLKSSVVNTADHDGGAPNIIEHGFLPRGYLMTDGHDHYISDTLNPSSNTMVDFPLNKIVPDEMASLRGVIFEDYNADGQQDQNTEFGFYNITVTVTELSSGMEYSTQTNRSGVYYFKDLMPYDVRVKTGLIDKDHLPQVGYGTTVEKRLDSNKTTTADFPMRHIHPSDTATISGVVFRDNNSNGVYESDEHGISDVQVTAYAKTTEQFERVETDQHGKFTISNVLPDHTRIVMSVPKGFSTTTSNGDTELHMLSDGETLSVRFGLQEITTTLDVLAFNDSNHDGIMDTGESAASGIIIITYVPDTDDVDVLVTRTDGSVTKSDLPAMRFFAIAVLPDGMVATTHKYVLGNIVYWGVLEVDDPTQNNVHKLSLGINNDP